MKMAYELSLVNLDWKRATYSSGDDSVPRGDEIVLRLPVSEFERIGKLGHIEVTVSQR